MNAERVSVSVDQQSSERPTPKGTIPHIEIQITSSLRGSISEESDIFEHVLPRTVIFQTSPGLLG